MMLRTRSGRRRKIPTRLDDFYDLPCKKTALNNKERENDMCGTVFTTEAEIHPIPDEHKIEERQYSESQEQEELNEENGQERQDEMKDKDDRRRKRKGRPNKLKELKKQINDKAQMKKKEGNLSLDWGNIKTRQQLQNAVLLDLPSRLMAKKSGKLTRYPFSGEEFLRRVEGVERLPLSVMGDLLRLGFSGERESLKHLMSLAVSKSDESCMRRSAFTLLPEEDVKRLGASLKAHTGFIDVNHIKSEMHSLFPDAAKESMFKNTLRKVLSMVQDEISKSAPFQQATHGGSVLTSASFNILESVLDL